MRIENFRECLSLTFYWTRFARPMTNNLLLVASLLAHRRRPPPFVVSNGDNGYNYEPLDEIRFPKIAREFPRSHWRVLRNNDGHYKIAHHLTPMNIYTSLSLARQYKEFLPEHERPPIDPMFDEEEDEEEEEKDQTIDALEKVSARRSAQAGAKRPTNVATHR